MNKVMKIIKMSTIIAAALHASSPQAAKQPEVNKTIQKTENQTENQMRILKFEEISQMAKDLEGKIAEKYPKKKWDGILAITRGGLVPAGMISQSMDIRRIEVINVKSYDEKNQGQLEQLNAPSVPNGGDNWLVIDDLSDTGKTFKFVRAIYPKAVFVSLMVKPKGEDAVDLYSAKFPQDLWLHFPWEPLEEKNEVKVS